MAAGCSHHVTAALLYGAHFLSYLGAQFIFEIELVRLLYESTHIHTLLWNIEKVSPKPQTCSLNFLANYTEVRGGKI